MKARDIFDEFDKNPEDKKVLEDTNVQDEIIQIIEH